MLLQVGPTLTLLLIVTSIGPLTQSTPLPSLVSYDISAKLSRAISITMNGNILYAIDSSGNLAIVNTTALPTLGASAITVASVLPFSSGGCCGNLAGDYGLVVKNGYAWIGAQYNVGYGLAQVSLQGLNSTVYFHGSFSAPTINGLAADANYVYVAASDVGIEKFDQRQHTFTTILSGSAPVNMLLLGTTLWFNHGFGIGRVNTDGTGLAYYTSGFSSYTAFVTNASDGRIWFTENQAHKIGVLNPSNSSVTEYGYPVPQGFFGPADGPYGLTFDSKGRLWVTGGANGNIEVFNLSTKTWTTAGSFPSPSNVYQVLNEGGNIWGSVEEPTGPFLFSSKLIVGSTSSATSLDVGQPTLFLCEALGGYAPYNYTWNFGDGSKGSGETATHSYASSGVMTATCQAKDSQNQTATANSTVTVSPDPNITTPSANSTSIETGQAVKLSTAVTNGLPGYSYYWQGQPSGCQSVNSPTLICVITRDGNYSIIVSAADANGFVAVSGPLALDVNPGPTILSFKASPPAIDLGQSVTLSVNTQARMPPVSYTYSSLPTGCATVSSATLTCTPATTGQYAITVQITDSHGVTATSTVTLGVNSPPALSSFSASPSPTDTSQTLKLTIQAASGTGVLNYAYSGLPQGCVSQDTPSLSCTPSAAGSYQVRVTVTDETGKNATSSINLTVNSAQVLGAPTSQAYTAIGMVAVIAAIATISVAAFWMKTKRPRIIAPATRN